MEQFIEVTDTYGRRTCLNVRCIDQVYEGDDEAQIQIDSGETIYTRDSYHAVMRAVQERAGITGACE